MKQKKMTLHEKAVRLCEGGVVECSGHFVRAIESLGEVYACMECSMDSACDMEMCNLCDECDNLTHTEHILKFANEQK